MDTAFYIGMTAGVLLTSVVLAILFFVFLNMNTTPPLIRDAATEAVEESIRETISLIKTAYQENDLTARSNWATHLKYLHSKRILMAAHDREMKPDVPDELTDFGG